MTFISSEPLISIVVPTYNCAEYLDETIQSILGQSHKNIELIIVDDGSTDQTKSVVSRYLSPNVSYFYQENFGGPSKARNQGLHKANGELICFFDSDDIMAPGNLERKCQIFKVYPEIDVVFSDYSHINEKGINIKKRHLDDYSWFRNELVFTTMHGVSKIYGEPLYYELLRANFIGTPGVVVMRTPIVKGAGGFDEDLKNADDVDLWYRLASAGHVFAFDNTVSLACRKRVGSVTGRGGGRCPSVLKMLIKQRKYAQSKRSLTVLEEKINRNLTSYGWHLRRSGDYGTAVDIYIKAIKRKKTFNNIRGLALSAFLQVIKRQNTNTVQKDDV